MSSKKGATLWLKDGWIFVRTPFDRSFKDDLKSEIPREFRRWSPEEKVWKVDPSQDGALVDLVTRYFGEPTILEDKEIVVVESEDKDPYSSLLSLAPNSVLKKVFRLIAAAVHPDAGGSGEKMTQANMAWSLIKQDRGM